MAGVFETVAAGWLANWRWGREWLRRRRAGELVLRGGLGRDTYAEAGPVGEGELLALLHEGSLSPLASLASVASVAAVRRAGRGLGTGNRPGAGVSLSQARVGGYAERVNGGRAVSPLAKSRERYVKEVAGRGLAAGNLAGGVSARASFGEQAVVGPGEKDSEEEGSGKIGKIGAKRDIGAFYPERAAALGEVGVEVGVEIRKEIGEENDKEIDKENGLGAGAEIAPTDPEYAAPAAYGLAMDLAALEQEAGLIGPEAARAGNEPGYKHDDGAGQILGQVGEGELAALLGVGVAGGLRDYASGRGAIGDAEEIYAGKNFYEQGGAGEEAGRWGEVWHEPAENSWEQDNAGGQADLDSLAEQVAERLQEGLTAALWSC